MNFSIKNKLLAGFTIILFGTLWSGLESLTTMHTLSNLTTQMYEHPLIVTKSTLQANNAIIKISRGMRDIQLAKNNTEMKKVVVKITEYETEALAELDIVKQAILGKEGEELLAETIVLFEGSMPARHEMIKLVEAGATEEKMSAVRKVLVSQALALSKQMAALTEYASVKAAGFNENAKATYDYVFIWMVVTTIVLFFLCILIAFVLIKHITQPLNALQKTINHIESNSDLTSTAVVLRQDEFGAINKYFNSMMESFNQAIGRVAGSSVEVSQAAEHTAEINLAARDSIASQHDQLHQLATSIEEMSASIAEVAENTTLAATSADNAGKETALGSELVFKTSQKVNDVSHEFSGVKDSVTQLEAQGNNVTAVLDVIKGVAEQTNLLALNAAIEAARAGEQGRGFAVVADEVRTLAQRTQDSTSEIEKMLALFATEIENAVTATENGQTKVAECVEQAEQATESLTNITAAVETIQQMSEQIACAAEEQSKVTEEVSSYIATISEASTETLNNVNESNVAITQQTAMAEELKGLAGKFIHS